MPVPSLDSSVRLHLLEGKNLKMIEETLARRENLAMKV